MNDDSLRMRLLARADLTFDTAVQEALLVTESGRGARRLQNDCSGGGVGVVNGVNELTKRISNTRCQNDRDDQGQGHKCLGCGGRHARSKCRFVSAKCYKLWQDRPHFSCANKPSQRMLVKYSGQATKGRTKQS